MEMLHTRVLRPTLCLLMLCWLTASAAQPETVTEYYPDGRPKLHKTETDGRAEGEWLEWYPNGTLRYRAWWSAGLGDGKWEYYYPNGQLRSETVYDRDRPVGLDREYHSNGVLARETVYVQGKRHGVERTYATDGTELTYARYSRDTLVVDRPRLFAPGIISSSERNEYGLTLNRTSDTVYFTSRAVDSTVQRIYRSTRVGETWSTPTLATFSTATDEGPALSADGNRLYFASFRAIPGRPPQTSADMNLWQVSRTGDSWGQPEPLPPSVNRIVQQEDDWPTGYEAGPTPAPDGYLYYWTGLSGLAESDIVRTRQQPDGSWEAPQPVTALSGPGFQSGAAFSPDGQLACFSAYGQPDGYGAEDIYCARRTATGWTTPVNIGPEINGPGDEGGISFSPDGRYFYFCSRRNGSDQTDIYYLESAFVPFPRSE